MNYIWIFVASNAHFPGGVFISKSEAEYWIKKHSLSGVLTEYPVGIGVFEWALDKGYFKPKPDKLIDSVFIGRFTTASMQHYHYELGMCSQ
jgi:hypothetical protein